MRAASRTSTILGAGAALLVCAWEGRVQARATFTVNNRDAAGTGFNDATPAAPVGGNAGTTLGQQRLNVFREAGVLWGRVLDSPVPIVIDAQFGPLACTGGRITLGQAHSASLEANRPGLPPNVYFPQPLADRIVERDLDPGQADIIATFNGDVAGCTGGRQDWYYGLDGKPTGSDVDLLSTVLHELGHGLGFASGVDLQTGALAGGFPDSFSSHLFDNAVGLAWTAMTNAQRAASTVDVRHLVWSGANVLRVAPQVLAKGSPRIVVTPAVSGFDGALSEASFGPLLAAGSRMGRLVVGTPVDGCALAPSYTGAIVLMTGDVCPSVQKASLVMAGGAIAALIVGPGGVGPPSSLEVPPPQRAMFTVTIPTLGLSENDAALLASATAATTVTLSADANTLVGADEQGRVYLYATSPGISASTVSHWDPLARPSLIMEPDATYDVSHDLTLEAALMRDIGWAPFCGNGRPDPDEQCDNGAANSDTAPGTCRTTCMSARCGDSVVDPGEQCDSGAANSDTMPGACRTTCMSARCGDSVVDPGEQCDSGPANSDTKSGACRVSCKSASCGDGVLNPGEQCDDGAANGPTAPCRPMCLNAPEDKGCGCATGAESSRAPAGGAGLLLLMLATARRRRRRDRR